MKPVEKNCTYFISCKVNSISILTQFLKSLSAQSFQTAIKILDSIPDNKSFRQCSTSIIRVRNTYQYTMAIFYAKYVSVGLKIPGSFTQENFYY